MSAFRSRALWVGLTICIANLPTSFAQDSVSPAEASFQQQFGPVIFKHCNGCHTYGGHAGGLRLDSYASLLKGGDHGPGIVPGDPKASLVVKAIRQDNFTQMPPAQKLAESDIASIEKWIVDVAHQSTVPAPAPSAPAVSSVRSPAPAAAAALQPKTAAAAVAGKPTPAQEQFFEAKIRPLLAKNCFTCHTETASGGLRLDSREALLKGGKDGAVVVPGHPETSLLVSAIHYDSTLRMPPPGPLKTEEVAAVEQWVRDGLPWPEGAALIAKPKMEIKRDFWSFQAPVHSSVPKTDSRWAYNDIDRFILAKLNEKHLKPVADADKRTLIRRVTYDLTGLPPTPEEVQSFLSDDSPQAYEKLVDRLLASRAYGERWGRMWLDVVRYADTTGGGGDYPIPQAYKYRDYVIQAFQDDKPYDRFIREQLAGDLLPASSEPEHWQNLIATGYLAGTVRGEGRPAYISDAVDNLGAAFLGLTVGCARCHDHKFDPIPTADYYALYGLLQSTHFPEPGNDDVRFQRGFAFRDPEALNRADYKIFQDQLKPIQNAIDAVLKLPGTYDDLIPQLEGRRMHLFAHMPDLGESAYAVSEGQPEDVRIQHYGDPKDLGDQVRRGFVRVLGGNPLPESTKGSGRMELADWIASKDNPLTARVIVNRIWQGHFGRGIVATPNDFGRRGVPPANQDLLDFLAWQFMDNGWSIKSLHKQILLSHAYRLSSAGSSLNEEVDPDNAYIWRHSRVRLDAEEIRDTLLADSQLLDRSPAGPFPFPPQAEWNWEDQNHFVPDWPKYETDRRTVYTMVQRDVRPAYFTLFDGPNVNASTEQRSSSLTPLQALYFLNAPFPARCASNLAALLAKSNPEQREMARQAFLVVYGRPATQAELDQSLAFLRNVTDAYRTHGAKDGPVEQSAFADFLRAMFASNEFMFIE
ncbi:MAG: PSD1 domain-containing protein [Acidobacteriia bacterium]|nr:PSD1 domain-containing protein [Terriglobia bacterium]